ncbi:uncharacterized protein LOC127080915 [Lathyrus oleraceus]|uniref:uncharacterized protein LOC127080915 n=1 Tax=Pisum sativum TaxID=3888 RepID=UPI0021D00161|nr:uncharacterized protein LOC127080915 [Pisum sativum]
MTLKTEVKRLMQSGILSFEDSGPNVQANPLPKHGGATVNMVEEYPGKYHVFDVNMIKRSLVEIHATLCEQSHYEHDHVSCRISSRNPRGCAMVKRGLQGMLDENLIQITRDRDEYEYGVNVIVPHFNIPEPVVIAYNSQKHVISPLVIRLAGPTPYESDRVVPYKYNTTMLEYGKGVPVHFLSSVVNIDDKSDHNEVLKLIKRREYNLVDQLLHTSSKISVLSLLMNLEAHREALQKVLEQAYVDHDVNIGQFDGIVANITACNNLSFSDEEFLEQGRNHNLDLHISMNCQEDVLSNVLVDTGSSLNVMPKSTLSKLSYQGSPMRYSGVVMKAFDGSRKTVIGEVNLPLKISPCSFHITFQVIDIHPAYSCLLGHPWIHEAGAVTSTLHQKLKSVKNGKLVIVGGEQAMLVISQFLVGSRKGNDMQ